MARVGRNDKCPCGSGKKHKNCCGARPAGNTLGSRLMMGVVLVMLLGAAYAGFNAMTSDVGSAGPAPGKVWSPEHGHYH
jgi:SEC-C motif